MNQIYKLNVFLFFTENCVSSFLSEIDILRYIDYILVYINVACMSYCK